MWTHIRNLRLVLYKKNWTLRGKRDMTAFLKLALTETKLNQYQLTWTWQCWAQNVGMGLNTIMQCLKPVDNFNGFSSLLSVQSLRNFYWFSNSLRIFFFSHLISTLFILSWHKPSYLSLVCPFRMLTSLVLPVNDFSWIIL